MPGPGLAEEELRLALATRLRSNPAVPAGIVSFERLRAGSSGTTYVAKFDDVGQSRIVVKMAVPGLPATRNRDVLRQARLLQALATDGRVPVPRVLFSDAAPPPYFAVAFVPGECFEPLSDPGAPPPSALVVERLEQAIEVLAGLHAVPAADLGVVEEPMAPAAELLRWVRLFETVEDSLRDGADSCAERLAQDVPVAVPPTLLHGDYRLGNILFDGPTPAAVVDWELWGVGDPRLDLAWLLQNSDPSRPVARRSGEGLPPEAALVRRYEEVSGVEVRDLGWFRAVANFKNAAALAAIVKHGRRRSGGSIDTEAMAPFIPLLLDRARRV